VRSEKAATEAEVQNLLVDTIAACDAAFPMQATDNLVATEECL
jgi:hypothetical protein